MKLIKIGAIFLGTFIFLAIIFFAVKMAVLATGFYVVPNLSESFYQIGQLNPWLSKALAVVFFAIFIFPLVRIFSRADIGFSRKFTKTAMLFCLVSVVYFLTMFLLSGNGNWRVKTVTQNNSHPSLYSGKSAVVEDDRKEAFGNIQPETEVPVHVVVAKQVSKNLVDAGEEVVRQSKKL